MNDHEILDWVQEHVSGIRMLPTSGSFEEDRYEITWIDDDGYTHTNRGMTLRDAVRKATGRPVVWGDNVGSL